MYPSPVSFDPDRLAEFGSIYRDHFAKSGGKTKEHNVIQCYKSGFSPEEIVTITGFSAEFIEDVATRFAGLCVVEFCRQHHQPIPHCSCYDKTKEDNNQNAHSISRCYSF